MTIPRHSRNWRPSARRATHEFENVSVPQLRRPGPDRAGSYPPLAMLEGPASSVEKRPFNDCAIPTAKFHAVDSWADLEAALADFGGQGVLKTRRLGYDGKGQKVFRSTSDSADGAFTNSAACR